MTGTSFESHPSPAQLLPRSGVRCLELAAVALGSGSYTFDHIAYLIPIGIDDISFSFNKSYAFCMDRYSIQLYFYADANTYNDAIAEPYPEPCPLQTTMSLRHIKAEASMKLI